MLSRLIAMKIEPHCGLRFMKKVETSATVVRDPIVFLAFEHAITLGPHEGSVFSFPSFFFCFRNRNRPTVCHISMRGVAANKIRVDPRCDMILKRAMLHVMLQRVLGLFFFSFLQKPLRRHLPFLFSR